MPLSRLIFLSSLVLVVAALSSATALGAANGTDRPIRGTSMGTTILNIATGAGIARRVASSRTSGGSPTTIDFTSFTLTGPNTFSFTRTTTCVAANGDKFFSTGSATGTLTLTEPSQRPSSRSLAAPVASPTPAGRTISTVSVIDSTVGSSLRTITSFKRTDQLLTGRDRHGRALALSGSPFWPALSGLPTSQS